MHTRILPLKDYMRFLNSTLTRPSLILFVVIFGNMSAIAQTDFISPYSIFGPGVVYPRQSVWQAGMGGSGGALFDLYRLNITNPAIAANHAEPIFEVGGRQSFSEFSSSTDSEKGTSFKINNLSLSFPIKRNIWNLSLGIVPGTSVGYEVTTSQYEPDLELNYLTQYNGEGGIAQAYLGTARKLINKVDSADNLTALSLGANINYNFGTVDKNRTLFFPEDLTILGFSSTESILIRDVTIDFGVHFHTNIIKRTTRTSRMLKLLLGAAYTLGSDLNAELSTSTYSFRPSASGAQQVPDTISESSRVKGRIYMPSSLTLSAALDYLNNKKSRYRFAIDYRVQQWSSYNTTFNDNATNFNFDNSQAISFGLECTPNVTSQKIFERLEYRVGYRNESTNLTLRDVPINEYGISFGLSLPIHYKRGTTFSSLNISTEYGEQGTNDSGLIKEQFVRVYVGFSLTPNFRNRWFVQPKYD